MHTSKIQFDIIVLFIIIIFYCCIYFYVLLYMYVNCLQLPEQFIFYFFIFYSASLGLVIWIFITAISFKGLSGLFIQVIIICLVLGVLF